MSRFAAALVLIAVTALAGSTTAAGSATGPQNSAGKQTFVVVGRVIDAVTGEPIGSALVTASPGSVSGRGAAPGGRGAASAPAERVYTDPDGRFVFPSLPAGSYALSANQADYFPGAFGQTRHAGPSRPLVLGAGERVTNVTIRMWKEGGLSGTIRDESGEPMADVRLEAVYVTGPPERRQYAARWSATTDDRGVYRFSSLPPGDVVIRVGQLVSSIPQEAAIAYLDAMASRSGNAIHDSATGSGGTLTTVGHLIDDQLVQIGRVGIPGAGVAASVNVDSAGRLSVYPLTFFPGVPTLAGARIVTLPPGRRFDGFDMTLRPVPAFRVSGRLTGGPASFVTVKIAPVGPESTIGYGSIGGEIAQAVTRADGSFTAIGIPAGRYTVAVTRPAATSGVDGPPVSDLRLWWASVPLTVINGDIKDVDLHLTPGVTVAGRIQFDQGATGPPPAGTLEKARVLLRPVIPLRELRGSAPVGPDGSFTSPEVPPGRYTLFATVTAPGWTLKSISVGGRDTAGAPLDVPASGLTNVVVTYTDTAGEVSGTVSANALGDDARVYLLPIDSSSSSLPKPFLLRSVETVSGQSYRFTAVLPGEYIVAALPAEAEPIAPEDKARIAALVRSGTRIAVAARGKFEQTLQIITLK
jgi:protocatechuate 3,4-dioxygenase beta subunit